MVSVNGALTSSPSFTPFTKKATLVTVPSTSKASAVMAMDAGVPKIVPATGALMATNGRLFVSAVRMPVSCSSKLMSELACDC